MSELSTALRHLADRIERGELLADATRCALVLGNEDGVVQATYIGRSLPASAAGIHLLAAGIQRFNNDVVRGGTSAAVVSASAGSTQ